jgi:hypothetical protein
LNFKLKNYSLSDAKVPDKKLLKAAEKKDGRSFHPKIFVISKSG